jgi:hypothetical protein
MRPGFANSTRPLAGAAAGAVSPAPKAALSVVWVKRARSERMPS